MKHMFHNKYHTFFKTLQKNTANKINFKATTTTTKKLLIYKNNNNKMQPTFLTRCSTFCHIYMNILLLLAFVGFGVTFLENSLWQLRQQPTANNSQQTAAAAGGKTIQKPSRARRNKIK